MSDREPAPLSDLVDRWVVLDNVYRRGQLPAAGPVVAWLFRIAGHTDSGTLAAAVKVAVVDVGDRLIAFGDRLDEPMGTTPELLLIDDELEQARPLPEADRLALGLPARHTDLGDVGARNDRGPDQLLTLARRLDQIGELTQAEDAYRDAVVRSDGAPFYLVHLAAFLAARGRVVEAIDTFRTARDIVLLSYDPFAAKPAARKLLGAIEVGLAETLLAFDGPKADLHRREAEVLLGNWRDDPELASEVVRLLGPRPR